MTLHRPGSGFGFGSDSGFGSGLPGSKGSFPIEFQSTLYRKFIHE